MKDGGPPHISRGAKQLLKDTFGENRVISRHFIYQWPPRSPDLTPCDFCLWGYIKSCVYRCWPTTLAMLKASIRWHVLSISTDMLFNAVHSVIYRLQAVIENKGCHIEQGLCFLQPWWVPPDRHSIQEAPVVRIGSWSRGTEAKSGKSTPGLPYTLSPSPSLYMPSPPFIFQKPIFVYSENEETVIPSTDDSPTHHLELQVVRHPWVDHESHRVSVAKDVRRRDGDVALDFPLGLEVLLRLEVDDEADVRAGLIWTSRLLTQ
ncbi:hypothetical protein LAZ67_16002195 [Cordylochernes scorpioides]|uniref:Uncharacterized protein n=1 Tax=Cordylochernes scorpioides TaxID=51811 RepID=A0ABY6LBS1_9ARAC|nr:hypothetical protein LAZ67_16002195 [Cordylochernes scorpioides]